MAYDIPTDNVLNARDVDRETRISELMTFASFEISPVWANIYNTSQGVFGIGDFNKDYIISRNYELGQEGIIKPDTGKTSLYGGSQVDAGAFTRFNDSMIDTAVWPDPQLSPTTKSVRLDIGMSAFLTNYNSTMGEALADADPRTIANILSGKDQRFAETVTRNQAHYFWANQNDNYSYCRAENVGTVDADYATASGAQPVLVFQTSNDAPSRFSEGQLVDFLYYEDQSGGATFEASDIAHDGFMGVVVNVDRLENKVYVRFINTSTGALATVDTVAAGDGETAVGSEDVTIPEGVYVVPHGTRGLQSDGSTQASMGMLGPNAFYKASGPLLGDEAVSTGTINVDQISRMKSKIKAVGGALTQQTLTRSLNNFNDAYRDQGHMIDTMVTTQGVVNEYLNNQAARRIADVGGAPYTLSNEASTVSSPSRTVIRSSTSLWIRTSRRVPCTASSSPTRTGSVRPRLTTATSPVGSLISRRRSPSSSLLRPVVTRPTRSRSTTRRGTTTSSPATFRCPASSAASTSPSIRLGSS
jgi:hypothetical protein